MRTLYVIVERDEDVVVYDTFNIDRAVESYINY